MQGIGGGFFHYAYVDCKKAYDQFTNSEVFKEAKAGAIAGTKVGAAVGGCASTIIVGLRALDLFRSSTIPAVDKALGFSQEIIEIDQEINPPLFASNQDAGYWAAVAFVVSTVTGALLGTVRGMGKGLAKSHQE